MHLIINHLYYPCRICTFTPSNYLFQPAFCFLTYVLGNLISLAYKLVLCTVHAHKIKRWTATRGQRKGLQASKEALLASECNHWHCSVYICCSAQFLQSTNSIASAIQYEVQILNHYFSSLHLVNIHIHLLIKSLQSKWQYSRWYYCQSRKIPYIPLNPT